MNGVSLMEMLLNLMSSSQQEQSAVDIEPAPESIFPCAGDCRQVPAAIHVPCLLLLGSRTPGLGARTV